MEGLIIQWLQQGIGEIEHDYKELKDMQVRPPANLWDVFRFNLLAEDILPFMRRKIREHKKELHALSCTCKDAYINGRSKIENHI